MLLAYICPNLNDAFDHYWQSHRPPLQKALRQGAQPPVQHLTTSAHTGNWLTQNIAQKQGVCANQRPQFLASYLWQLVERADANLSDRSPFEPTICVWAIYQYLQVQSSFDALAQTQLTLNATARFSLAGLLAAQFDRYLVFRLDWLAAWQNKKLIGLGPHESWQADLWRSLLKQLPGIQLRHPFESLEQLLQRNADSFALSKARDQLRLPRQLIVWAMDSVPALYWDILRQLGEYTDITMYLFDVSPVFTQDLVTRKEWLAKQLNNPAQTTYLEVGHPLLSHWGREQAQQQRCLLERDINFAFAEETLNSGDSQLHWLQQSIRSAYAPTQIELAALRQAGNDTSLMLFSAHSLRRQLEALAQQLTIWLAEKTGSRQAQRSVADVLIICPDLAQVRTYVPGVFQDFSFRFGQSLAQQHGWVKALLGWYQLIDQTQGQTGAQAVLDWLGQPEAQAMTLINSSQVAQWQVWLQQAGVRTLSDWPVGFERLLLGMTVDIVPSNDSLSRQPVNVGDESDLASLSSLAQLFEKLIFAQAQALDSRTIEQWLPVLAVQFESVGVAVTTNAIEAQEGQAAIRTAVQILQDNIRRSGTQPVMSWPVLIAALSDLLAAQRSAGVASGALTFAGPNDVRHCAYKLIVWIGLDDGVFPRPGVQTAFDLMASRPRWGDQVVGVQDRGIFLESIMLAQEQFWLFYRGRDLRRNDPLNPSVLITDLLRLMPWLVEQPIALATPAPINVPNKRFSDWPLVTTLTKQPQHSGLTTAALDLRQLKRFVENPARHYAKEALGLHLEWRPGLIDVGQNWVLKTKAQDQLMTSLYQGIEQRLIDHPEFAPALLGAAQAQQVKYAYAAVAQIRRAVQTHEVAIQDRGRYYASMVLSAWVEQLHHCATENSPLPLALFSWHDAKVFSCLNVISTEQAKATLTWLRTHEQLTRSAPSLLLGQAAYAWAQGHSEEKIEAALLGSDEDSAFSLRGDLSESYAALVWRANPPKLVEAIAFFEEHLNTLRIMLDKGSEK
jgi:exonuclease V gamma subunit